MFFAAFTSLSCRVRQPGQVQARVDSFTSASRCPHAEHVFELGYQRSITTSVRPARCAVYSSGVGNSPQPQSEITGERRLCRPMLHTVSSATMIVSHCLT